VLPVNQIGRNSGISFPEGEGNSLFLEPFGQGNFFLGFPTIPNSLFWPEKQVSWEKIRANFGPNSLEIFTPLDSLDFSL